MRNSLLFYSGNPFIELSDGGKEKRRKKRRKKVKKKRLGLRLLARACVAAITTIQRAAPAWLKDGCLMQSTTEFP